MSFWIAIALANLAYLALSLTCGRRWVPLSELGARIRGEPTGEQERFLAQVRAADAMLRGQGFVIAALDPRAAEWRRADGTTASLAA